MSPAPAAARPRRRLRRVLAALVLAAGAAGVGYAVGPRRVLDPAAAPDPRLPDEPAAVAAAIAAREAEVAGVRSGCAARVAWRGGAPARASAAVVYLHGFSATRQETAPFAAELAAALDANLYEARLRGHGRDGAALGAARGEEWLADALEAAAVGARLGRRVVLVGCSTGATLAAWVAASGRAPELAAVVLISPNFGVRHPAGGLLAGPWGRQLARLVEGEERAFRPHNAEQAAFWTTRYPTGAVVEMAALVDLVDRTDLGRLTAPTLVVYSPADRVVEPARVEARFAELGARSKRLVPFTGAEDPASHVLAGRVLSPDATDALVELAAAFCRPHVEGTPGG